jgi:hypothetical protein
MAETVEVLNKLFEHTRKGKLSWRTSAGERTFIAVIGNNSVIISSPDPPEVVLTILDKSGRELDRLDSRSFRGPVGTMSGQHRSTLEQLYGIARNLALGVPSQLDELLKQLEAST